MQVMVVITFSTGVLHYDRKQPSNHVTHHIICVILKQHFQFEKQNVLEQGMKDIFCCVCVAETMGIICASLTYVAFL